MGMCAHPSGLIQTYEVEVAMMKFMVIEHDATVFAYFRRFFTSYFHGLDPMKFRSPAYKKTKIVIFVKHTSIPLPYVSI